MNENVNNWESIYKNKGPGSFLNYPNELLVSLFYRYKQYINIDGKCLDYGFGSGNNSEFLIQHMQGLYGIEISESALLAIANRLSKYKNFKSNNFSLEFGSNFCNFDLIVAWQVLCYNTKNSFHDAVAKMINSLNKNGVFIVSLSTHVDTKVVTSKKIDENTFIISDMIPHQTGCTMYSPSSEDDFLQLFQAYALDILDYGYFVNMSYKMPDRCLSEYYLVARKK